VRALENVALSLVLPLLTWNAATAPGALAREETPAISPPGTISADGPRVDQLRGIYVQGVEPGSAADEAGIEQGDIIVAVDRKPVSSPLALFEAVRNHKSDTPILLQIRRGDSVVCRAKSQIRG